MGTVIKFPRVRRGRHERLSKADGSAADAPATIVILPAVRIERTLDTPGAKAKAVKPVAKPPNKSVTKPTRARKRRKHAAPELPSQVYGRG